ncbi:MAG: hypothetical protein EBS56_07920 [Planctomycetia bacterium]|nr:hypothetical protein [Planctomycetia bacterium]
MRLPRFFGKKRGHRRTGSQAWGSAGEAIFYALLVAAALCFAGLLLTGVVGLDPEAVGLPWAGWWLWIFTALIPGALLAFGGAGLVRTLRGWDKSEERRAAAETLAELLEPVGHGSGSPRELPGVPTCDDLVNSPGTILRYRLPIESPESWQLLGIGLFAALWNAVLAVLAVTAGLDLLGGRVEPVLLALLVPFLAVGIGGIVVFVRRLFLTTAVGTTQVEISDHPLLPGANYDVLLAQGGAGAVALLRLTLEMEESAAFRQGTDTRTERVVVWREVVKEWRDVRISPGVRFEAHATITIPRDAMHSFVSEHNAVRWRIVVHGRPERRAPFERMFPLVVHPLPPDIGGGRPEFAWMEERRR